MVRKFYVVILLFFEHLISGYCNIQKPGLSTSKTFYLYLSKTYLSEHNFDLIYSLHKITNVNKEKGSKRNIKKGYSNLRYVVAGVGFNIKMV